DGLVAAAAHQHLRRLAAVKSRQRLHQRGRPRVAIAAAAAARIGRVGPGAFVGVEPDLAIQRVAARGTVAAEAAQVFADQGKQVVAHAAAPSRRRATALACASSRSARAMVTAQSPMARMPSRLAACTLTKFWKLATLTPLQARAAPLVGRTWLVPLQ